jgi:hypothetical protein
MPAFAGRADIRMLLNRSELKSAYGCRPYVPCDPREMLPLSLSGPILQPSSDPPHEADRHQHGNAHTDKRHRHKQYEDLWKNNDGQTQSYEDNSGDYHPRAGAPLLHHPLASLRHRAHLHGCRLRCFSLCLHLLPRLISLRFTLTVLRRIASGAGYRCWGLRVESWR